MKYEKSDIRKGMVLELDGGPVEEPVRKSTPRPIRYGEALPPAYKPFAEASDRLTEIGVRLEKLRADLRATRGK